MATKIKTARGKTVTLLNPAEKGEKYAKELKQGIKRTNEGTFKLDENRKGLRLTSEEKAYRAGYLDARNDNAKCFNSQQKKKVNVKKKK